MVKVLTKEAFRQLSAFIYMDNDNKTKYGSLLLHLSEQHSLKNTQHPKAVVDANNVFSNHSLIPRTRSSSSDDRASNSRIKTAKKRRTSLQKSHSWRLKTDVAVAAKLVTRRHNADTRTSPKPNGQSTIPMNENEFSTICHHNVQQTIPPLSQVLQPASHAQASTTEGNNKQEMELPPWMAVQ